LKIEKLINREFILMKTILITIDPELLHRIDNDEEAIKKGRSAFLRQAVRYYLEQKRLKLISEEYRSGYKDGLAKDGDLTIWENEQVWPLDIRGQKTEVG
jgi:hypothetical protein